MEETMKAKMDEVFQQLASINPDDLKEDYRPFLVIYKDGRIHRFLGTATIPPGPDPLTGVESKDVVISPETGVFVRVFKPPTLKPGHKVPVLMYFHGGGFCIETAASPVYHLYLNALSCKANVVIVSVDYRLAPECPLPAGYEDSWCAVKSVADAGDEWVKEHGDLGRVFFAGDSAGANIAHHMAKRMVKEPIPNLTLNGIILIHPFFWGSDRIGSEERKLKEGAAMAMATGTGLADKLWKLVCPTTSGSDDPLINPLKDPELASLGGQRVLVLVAEQDMLRDRGVHYKEALLKSGWKGEAEMAEAVGENHVFHLFNPTSANASQLMSQMVAFINKQ